MENLNIEKWKIQNNKDGISGIILKRGKLNLEISFQGNLDLYFSLYNFNSNPTFLIGKDNYKIYKIFDTLYFEVINGITFIKLSEEEIERIIFFSECSCIDYHEELKRKEEIHKEMIESSLKHASATGLIQNDSIIWSSDDFNKEIAPFFKIDKLENAYKISFGIPKPSRKLNYEEEFFLPKLKDNFISIRLRNSGSTYGSFTIPFMKLFNTLMSSDLKDNQIYLEEYLIKKELNSGKNLEHILTKSKKIGR